MELPKMEISINGEEREATPDNTFLFLYAGRVGMYNHIFHVDDEDDDRSAYIFERLHPEAFNTMQTYMMETGYPMHINMRQVAQCDVDAFNQNVDHFASQEVVPDTLPEDW